MNFLFFRIFLFLFTIFLLNCSPSKKSGDGSTGSRSAPTVSIVTDLESITASNIARFVVSGSCSEESQPVIVVFGEGEEALSPETAPHCMDGSWSTEIDLSSLTGPSRVIAITADHSIDNLNATQATGGVLLSPRVSIATDLEGITASNIARFVVSGICSEEGQPVIVVFGEGEEALSPETAPHCMGGSWSTEIDLSSLTGPSKVISITADHATSGDTLEALQATESVTLYPRVSIDTGLPSVTSTNAETFEVTGTCSEEGEPVTVSAGTVTATSTCATDGTWTVEVDLRGLSGGSISITADHATSGDTLEATQAIESVTAYLTFSIDDLENITAANAASFRVSGTCLEEGEPVTVSVGSISPETNPDCTNGAWTIDIDVTGLNKSGGNTSVTADHSPESGTAHPQQTKTVTNNFTCPASYVGAPALADYTINSFCVMKYEAKSDGSDTDDDGMDSNNALSQASGTPYVNIDRNTSIAKCMGLNGEDEDNYDLITNDEWQSLARNIELVSSNWATGAIGNAGGLSRGHSDSVPDNALAAHGNDNMSCHETGQTCSSTSWNSQRRTHTLSNGEVIWDISGNVWEWVKDDNAFRYGTGAYFSQVTATSHPTSNSLSGGTTTISRNAKDQFGPSGDYTNLDTAPYGNLGYGTIGFGRGGVLRGARWNSSTSYGVFAAFLAHLPTHSSGNIGFRCAYHP